MDPLPPPRPKPKRGRPRKAAPVPLPPPTQALVHAVVAAAADPYPADAEFEPYVPPEDDDGPEDYTAAERDELREVLAELSRREREALRLFEPMPEQARFFASMVGERLVRGGNRGGKTVVGAVECARAVTATDPHGKYPRVDGRFVAVGKDLTHCGKVMWRKLSRPGAFKIIRDPETGRWRSYRPGQVWDDAHREKAKDAPALIPARFIKEVAWENKKDEIPKTVRLQNGWELCFFSSVGKPPQGWDVDAVWFDEEIEHPDWYTEMAARLPDRGGRFYWTATPQAGTLFLYDLHLRAEGQLEAAKLATAKGEPVEPTTCQEFYLSLLTNPHIDDKAKKEFAAKLSEDEYRIRVLGDFALLGMKVYPEFSPHGPHGCEPFPIPHDWTRYVAIDPGRQVCAILFAAVPPPSHEFAGRVILYDELYIQKSNAKIFADALRAKLAGQEVAAYLIDMRAGRVTEMGSGLTVEEQFRAEMFRVGLFSRLSGRPTGFLWSTASGGDNVKAGIEAVRVGLHLNEQGRSKWLVFRALCKKFCEETGKYVYRKLPSGLVTDEPVKAHDHLMDCWRYLAMTDLKYRRPRAKKQTAGYTNQILKQKRAKARREGGCGESIKLG